MTEDRNALERWADIRDDDAAIVACGERWKAVAASIGCGLHGFNDGRSASFYTPDGNVIEVGPKFRAAIASILPPTTSAGDGMPRKQLVSWMRERGLWQYELVLRGDGGFEETCRTKDGYGALGSAGDGELVEHLRKPDFWRAVFHGDGRLSEQDEAAPFQAAARITALLAENLALKTRVKELSASPTPRGAGE